MIWRTILVIVAFLLLAAHFLRGGHVLLVALCLFAPLLLLIRRQWARVTVQWLLYFGAAVWAYTAYILAQGRLAEHGPWIRMLVIMGAVTLFTLLAGGVLSSARARQRYSAQNPADA